MTALELPDFGDRALCATSPTPDFWFPLTGESSEQAKGVCRRCPVRQDCLDWALTKNETHGVWGGLSPKERQAIRRLRGQGPKPPDPRVAPTRHRRVLELTAQGRSNREIALELGVAASTVSYHRRTARAAASGAAATSADEQTHATTDSSDTTRRTA